MKKRCPSCKLMLSTSEFNWKIKNKTKAGYCKKCSRKYIRNHYLNNREYYLNKAKKRNKVVRDMMQEYVASYLQKNPCIDCGETDLLVLEFDHRERSEKRYNISHIIKNNMTEKQLFNEIKKCEVRCSNCHRRKTEKETDSWRLKYLRQ